MCQRSLIHPHNGRTPNNLECLYSNGFKFTPPSSSSQALEIPDNGSSFRSGALGEADNSTRIRAGEKKFLAVVTAEHNIPCISS